MSPVAPARPWWQPRLRLVAAGALLWLAGTALATPIDSDASTVAFSIKTRWGQTLEGRFPRVDGRVLELAEDMYQVRLQLPTREVEIDNHPRFTRLTRGEGFFEADTYPVLEFVSDPYTRELLLRGGELGGFMTLRGVRRRETLTLAPAGCDRPGRDCDVVVSHTVRRNDYGMDRWNVALSERVRLSLRIRLAHSAR